MIIKTNIENEIKRQQELNIKPTLQTGPKHENEDTMTLFNKNSNTGEFEFHNDGNKGNENSTQSISEMLTIPQKSVSRNRHRHKHPGIPSLLNWQGHDSDGRPNRTLYIGGLFELSDNSHEASARSELDAALLAVRHVNEKGVVPGYNLQLVYNDSKVSRKL